jgi:hypothetical protein
LIFCPLNPLFCLPPAQHHESQHLNVIIGGLAFAAVVFGYRLYQERQKTTGVEISVGNTGVSIEKK